MQMVHIYYDGAGPESFCLGLSFAVHISVKYWRWDCNSSSINSGVIWAIGEGRDVKGVDKLGDKVLGMDKLLGEFWLEELGAVTASLSLL